MLGLFLLVVLWIEVLTSRKDGNADLEVLLWLEIELAKFRG